MNSPLRLSLLFALVLCGCSPGDREPTARTALESEVLEEIRDLSYERILGALSELERASYTETVSIRELSGTVQDTVSSPVGTRSYTKIVNAGISVLDSTTVQFDVTDGSVVEGMQADDLPQNIPQLPFDLPPIFVSEKQSDHFSYSARDTIVGGVSYRTYSVLDDRTTGEATSRTVLLVDTVTNEVVEIDDARTVRALLFRAQNRVNLKLSLQEPSRDVVEEYGYDLNLKTPFKKPRRFVVKKTFEYGPSSVVP